MQFWCPVSHLLSNCVRSAYSISPVLIYETVSWMNEGSSEAIRSSFSKHIICKRRRYWRTMKIVYAFCTITPCAHPASHSTRSHCSISQHELTAKSCKAKFCKESTHPQPRSRGFYPIGSTARVLNQDEMKRML